MSGEPVPVGDSARELVQTLRAGLRDPGNGDEGPVPEPPDEAELARVREAGRVQLAESRWHAVCPQRFHRAQLEDFDGDTGEALWEWSRQPQGRNLVLLGPVGTGKTHAALAAVRDAHGRGMDLRFMPMVELLDMLRPGGPEGALYDLADVDRLVVDDVGSEKPTDWTAERFYALVNRRWLEELPTVFTSNLPAAELEQHVGPRTFSRLVGSDAVVIGLKGHDRRRRKP